MAAIEELLGMGAKRVILGTAAIVNPELVARAAEKYGETIAVGIDARDGKVAIEGWGVTSEKDALELAVQMKARGVNRLVFTDIKRDGTLKGPNLAATERVARVTGLKIIAAGGISNMEDLIAVAGLEHAGVEAVITGKALYAGSIIFKDALALIEKR